DVSFARQFLEPKLIFMAAQQVTAQDITALITLDSALDQAILRGDAPMISSNGDGFHVEDLISSARGALDLDRDLVSIADWATSRALGALPPYHHVTWRCRKPN
ncbi:MAG: hypothetical protein ACO3N1_11055, partial [Ilumatobacteraceae bacterium]